MRYFRHNQAFTLIEVLFAVIIIGVGIIPVLMMFIQGTKTVEKGGVILEASIAAQNIMDRARSDSFIRQGIPRSISIPDPNYPEFTIPENLLEKYNASATLSLDYANGHTVIGTGAKEENLYQLNVILHWLEGGIKRQFSLLNYRANTNSVNLKTSVSW